MIVGAHQNRQFIPVGDTGVKLANCWQIVLGHAEDLTDVGVRPSTPLRIQSPTVEIVGGLKVNVGLFADLVRDGTVFPRFCPGAGNVGGLDAGTKQPNTDYYLWFLSNGITYGLVWSTSVEFPDLTHIGADYVFGALQMWNRTDANSKLLPIQKVDKRCAFLSRFMPLASGVSSPAWQAIHMPPFVGPNAACIEVCIQCPDANAVCGVSAEPPIGQQEEFQVSPYGGGMVLNRPIVMSSGYIYYRSTGPNALLSLVCFDDVL